MLNFQAPTAMKTRQGRSDLTTRHRAQIAQIVSAALTYRRLTRVGPPPPRTKLAVGLAVALPILAQVSQRGLATNAVALNGSSRPSWHTDQMLPLMVADSGTDAVLGRTETGPVVIFGSRLLKTGTVEDQIAAYQKAADSERRTRPDVVLAFNVAVLTGSWLLRRAVLGKRTERVAVSKGRAVTYVALDLARSTATTAALHRFTAAD